MAVKHDYISHLSKNRSPVTPSSRLVRCVPAQHQHFVPLLLLAAASLLLAGCGSSSLVPEVTRVTIADRTFILELALDDSSRHQGLSDRASIAPDGGMLFAFPQARKLSFVMRRCLVPIDIIFLDASSRIVAMHEMAIEPYDTPESALKRYPSHYPAQFVIELAGGTLKTLDLKLGQQIDLPVDRLRKWAR